MAIRVHLKHQKNVTIMCQPYDPIQSLLQEYEEKTRISYKKMQFLYGDLELSDHCKQTVGSLKIKDGQTIHVGSKERGGLQAIPFNKMDNPIYGGFSNNAPKWRVIAKGLNLEGRCKNSDCQAFNKKVWIQKGFGKLNMNKEVKMSKCPLCQKFCK